MAKTYDRISAFLGKPKTRLKHRNDQSIETQTKKEMNKFAEKTEFMARVIGLPRIDEGSTFTSADSAMEIGMYDAVYVRTMDIDEYFLPDPAEMKAESSDVIVDLILAHPVATISTEAGSEGIKLGAMVLCTFDQNPGSQGKQRGLKIVKVLESADSDAYAEKLMGKLTSGGLGPLAALYDNGGYSQAAEGTNTDDFAGRYSQASPTVKRFLDDLVKIIKANDRKDLLPINVGSLYRSLRDQSVVMWENVVEGNQSARMGWFDKTYKPNSSYASSVQSATKGTNYGYYGGKTSTGNKIKKFMQYLVKIQLQLGIDKKSTKDDGIAEIASIYHEYYDNYQIVPSRHNLGQAVDIRTNEYSRKQIEASVYSTKQKEDLKAFAKKSAYCTFADIESPNKSGEHLHCNSKSGGEE